MKYLKDYKLFESVTTENILFDLDDITIDLEDSKFILKREFLFARWYEYWIKDDKVMFDLTRWQKDEELELKNILNIRGFQFLFDVNFENFDTIKESLIRVIKYIKGINNSKFVWNTRIDYSYSENTDNMRSLLMAVNLTSHDDDVLDKLINGLKIYEQVPKRIKITIYKT